MPADPSTEAPSFPGDPRHQGEMARLDRLLRHPAGFALVLAEYGDSAYRETIMAHLAAAGLVEAKPLMVPPDESGLNDLIQALTEAPAPTPVNVCGLDTWLRGGDPDARLNRLNFARERLAGAAGRPLLVWLNPEILTRLAREAPDLWSWRAAVLDFLRPMEESEMLPPRRTWTYVDVDEIKTRIAEIDGLLERFLEAGSLTLSLLLERGELHQKLGEHDLALADFERSRALAAALEDEYGTARAWGGIADILQARGDLDEALRIRTQEELPVYERLGDVRSKAVTLGQIADILQARGEFDEALRIRTQEELAVYERLGDVRSKAVALGKVADVLQVRGDIDEAMRIRTKEELPVFERLGDVRAKAVTLGKVADILQARGDIDEAMRIRTQEQLPVFERLGDVRAKAVTLGKIADILQARGDLDEVLRIRTQEQLPVYERLGDVRAKAVCTANIGITHMARGDLDAAERCFAEAEAVLTRLNLPPLLDALRTHQDRLRTLKAQR